MKLLQNKYVSWSAFVVITIVVYCFLGSFKQILSYNAMQSMQPEIEKMKQQIAKDPNLVIKTLEQYPNDPKAQIVLFKIYVGLANYAQAHKIYQHMATKTKDIEILYASIIPYVYKTCTEQLSALSILTKSIDVRLYQYMQAEIYAQHKIYKKSLRLYQKVLGKLDLKDPFYNVVSKKINALPRS